MLGIKGIKQRARQSGETAGLAHPSWLISENGGWHWEVVEKEESERVSWGSTELQGLDHGLSYVPLS